jgi:hypothetical protein
MAVRMKSPLVTALAAPGLSPAAAGTPIAAAAGTAATLRARR